MADLLAQSASGKTNRELSVWLEQKYEIKVAHTTIGRWVKEHRAERSEAIRDKVVEALAPHVTSDLDLLTKWQVNLDKVAESLLSGDSKDDELSLNTDGLAKIVGELRKLTELKLKHAGAAPESGAQTLADFFASGFDPD